MEKINLKFEKFTAAGGKFSYTISLNKAGGFSFSSGFCKKHGIEEYPYVLLWYEKKAKAVGFSFLKEATKGAFKLSFTKSKTASVRPNSFIRAHEIKYQLFAGKYDPKRYKTEGGEEIFYIVLEKQK